MLRATVESFVDPAVYYNRREKKGSEAELGYFLAHGSRVVPLEVTAGATGSLKALHHFMHRRQLLLAVRINADPISATPVEMRLNGGDMARYTLLSIPFYLTGQVRHLLPEL